MEMQRQVIGPRIQPTTNTHPCEPDPLLTERLTYLQSLRVAASTGCTYQAVVNAYLKFCLRHSIQPLPATQLTLRYFCRAQLFSVVLNN